ncbi:MAG TPA: hypothetical protein VEC57_17920 [Candidatus Limnocylindrales bacterium]|nr:hypothetical protein [Candidatus Limnocylindrales bacterium]
MTMGAQQEFRRSRGIAMLFYGMLAAPLALAAHLLINYALVHLVCSRYDRQWLHVLAALFVLIAASGAAMSVATWRRAGAHWPDTASDVLTRARFLSALGLGTSALIVLVLIAQWMATAFIDPCMR